MQIVPSHIPIPNILPIVHHLKQQYVILPHKIIQRIVRIPKRDVQFVQASQNRGERFEREVFGDVIEFVLYRRDKVERSVNGGGEAF